MVSSLCSIRPKGSLERAFALRNFEVPGHQTRSSGPRGGIEWSWMSETKKRRGGETKVTRILPESSEAPQLHGIAENLYNLQQDMVTAGQIQARMLPPKPKLSGYDFEVYYQPAGEV